MKHPHPGLLCFALAAGLLGGGCGKTPEPSAQAVPSAQAPPSAAGGDAGVPPRLARDDAGHLLPHSPAPEDSARSATTAKATREPDWDLDSDDPARDYVRRYAFGTKRYGDTLDCVDVGASRPAEAGGSPRRVEVKTAAGCAGAGTVRDVFLVDVASDRLSVDDKARRDPLARWPDGSDPEGPPGPVREIDTGKQWTGPLKEAIQGRLLVPIRVQSYGRGTYPVVTLAGWHGDIVPTASAETLRGFATTLCKANGGAPMGLFAGIDRSVLLRIRCPAAFRWDKL